MSTDSGKWMKVEIGGNSNESFKIYGRSGADITDELDVEKVAVYAEAGKLTRAVLTVFAEVDAEIAEADLNVDKIAEPEEVSG